MPSDSGAAPPFRDSYAATVLKRAGVELAAWLLLSGAFLAIYVTRFSFSWRAALPHLCVIGALWLAVAAVRSIVTLLPYRAFASLLSAIVVATVGITVVAYYSLVLVGLDAWGRVVSWDLIYTYLLQFPALVDALGYATWEVIAISAVTLLVAIALVFVALRRFDWVPLFVARTSPVLVAVAVGAMIAIFGVQLYQLTAAPWTADGEPLSLTFFPRELSRVVQSHRIDRSLADRLDRLEDEARASYVPSGPSRRRNVVLIVVDALRADHLPMLGYARNTMPNLAEVSRGATSVAALPLHSACAESACGLMSLASSKYVHEFSNRPITLTEVLKRNGYRVHLILSGDHTHFYGLREAYGKVDTYFDGSMSTRRYFNDDELVLDEVASLPAWDREPAMFQFHLMSTHLLGRRKKPFEVFLPAENYALMSGQGKDDGPRAAAVNYYDDGILQTDAIIARLLTALREKGYLSNALVVITADHGELLGEHGLFKHARSVYEQVLKVPLILLSFGYDEGNRIEPHMEGSQVDVGPTILADLGIPQPKTWIGKALQGRREPQVVYFQEGSFIGLYDRRDVDHAWKYYVDARNGTEHITDVLANPQERDDVVVRAPEARLREWRSLILQARVDSTD